MVVSKIDKAFFLYLLHSISELMGPDFAKGVLQRIGEKTAEKLVEKFTEKSLQVNSLKELTTNENPLTIFEENIAFVKDRIFIVEKCPFRELVSSFLEINKTLPAELSEIVKIYNDEGLGAAVSPFCIIHQSFRKKIVNYIRMNGKSCELQQLGCKAASGTIKYAPENFSTVSTSEGEIADLLKDKACSYTIVVKS